MNITFPATLLSLLFALLAHAAPAAPAPGQPDRAKFIQDAVDNNWVLPGVQVVLGGQLENGDNRQANLRDDKTAKMSQKEKSDRLREEYKKKQKVDEMGEGWYHEHGGEASPHVKEN